MEHQEGWSSGGENSDGGAPVYPVNPAPAAATKSIPPPQQAKPYYSKYSYMVRESAANTQAQGNGQSAVSNENNAPVSSTGDPVNDELNKPWDAPIKEPSPKKITTPADPWAGFGYSDEWGVEDRHAGHGRQRW